MYRSHLAHLDADARVVLEIAHEMSVMAACVQRQALVAFVDVDQRN
jgi:hypothetical protein